MNRIDRETVLLVTFSLRQRSLREAKSSIRAAVQLEWCSAEIRGKIRRWQSCLHLLPFMYRKTMKNLCHWYLRQISIISCGLRHLLITFNQPVAVWFAHSSAVFAPVIIFSFRFPSWGHVLEDEQYISSGFFHFSTVLCTIPCVGNF